MVVKEKLKKNEEHFDVILVHRDNVANEDRTNN